MRFFFARHLSRLAFVGLLGAVGWAQAQTFPSRPVTLLLSSPLDLILAPLSQAMARLAGTDKP